MGFGWAERRRVKVEREVRPDLEASQQSEQVGPAAAGGGRVNQWGGRGAQRSSRGEKVETLSRGGLGWRTRTAEKAVDLPRWGGGGTSLEPEETARHSQPSGICIIIGWGETMAVSDRTRKILWGRSGNLCAYCRRVLVEQKTRHDEESVVGDECHIIGEKPAAARGSLGVGRDDLDEYENLILLCKVHHKLVDDQPETHPAERLRELKASHERWVSERLSKHISRKAPRVVFLPRLLSGRDLASVVGGAHAFAFDHEELVSEEETKLVAGFLQNLQDWGDLWDGLDSGEHVEARFTLTKSLKEIEAEGLLVFGARGTKRMRMNTNNEVFDWDVASITVVRSTNPGITEVGNLATLVGSGDGLGVG